MEPIVVRKASKFRMYLRGLDNRRIFKTVVRESTLCDLKSSFKPRVPELVHFELDGVEVSNSAKVASFMNHPMSPLIVILQPLALTIQYEKPETTWDEQTEIEPGDTAR
jgi:hypothetical protein